MFYLLNHTNYDVVVLCPVFPPNNSKCIRVNDFFVKGTTCQTALGYVCKDTYYDTLLNNFKEALDHLEIHDNDDMFAIDQYWKKLQIKDNWLFAYPIIGKQRPDYSNILNRPVNYDSVYGRKLQES